jgi:hypothetical protein
MKKRILLSIGVDESVASIQSNPVDVTRHSSVDSGCVGLPTSYPVGNDTHQDPCVCFGILYHQRSAGITLRLLKYVD